MPMRWLILLSSIALGGAAAEAQPGAPLQDGVALNIGLNCQWQLRCMEQQRRAMEHALKFVEKYQPPNWRVQLCNHNAERRRYRVDWVGFNNCIRNATLRPLPPRPLRKRSRRIA